MDSPTILKSKSLNQCHWAKSQTLARGFLLGASVPASGGWQLPLSLWLHDSKCWNASSNLILSLHCLLCHTLCLPLIGTLVITFRIIQDNVFNLITSASTFFFFWPYKATIFSFRDYDIAIFGSHFSPYQGLYCEL